MTKNILYVLLSAMMIFSGCRKDIETTDEVIVLDPGSSEPGIVTGRVVDQSGSPVPYATVMVDGRAQLLDTDGYFIFSDAMLASRGFIATASKMGYLDQVTRKVPISGGDTYTEILLPYEVVTAELTSNDGGSVSDSLSNFTVTVTGNTLETDDGTAYAGAVSVVLEWHEAQSMGREQEWPGNLSAIVSDGSQGILSVVGMMDMRYMTPDCQRLELQKGASAVVTMHIPDLYIDAAPESIPLWQFDEAYGLWLEAGVAVRDGDVYTFTIKEFGLWSCGIVQPSVMISGLLVDDSGLPVPHQSLTYTYKPSARWTGVLGYSNSEGRFIGHVPRGLDLEFLASDKVCDFGTDIGLYGPFEEDQDMGQITIGLASPSVFSGIAYGCTDEALADAAIYLQSGNRILGTSITGSDGSFDVYAYCPNEELRIRVYDPVTQYEGASALFAGSNGNQNVGEIIVCNLPSNFVNVISDIGNATFAEPTALTDPDSGAISISVESGQGLFSTTISNPNLDPVSIENMVFERGNLYLMCHDVQGQSCDDMVSVEISRFDDNVIEGRFSGALFLNPADTDDKRKIEVIFRIRI